MDRTVILVCGLGTTGKSYWTKMIAAFLNDMKPQIVDLDEVRTANWGQQHLSDIEHVFKNELTRMEVKKKFVIDKARVVILNMTMLTEEKHQKPFVEMLEDTSRVLGEIEGEPVKIKIKAIWMDCDYKTTVRRIERKRQDPDNISDVIDVSVFENGRRQFEPPGKYYPFIKIDTSDESPEATIQRAKEIFEFIQS